MRQLFILCCSALLIFSSCKKNETPPVGADSLNGRWTMTRVIDMPTGAEMNKPTDLNGDVQITFSSSNNINGVFFGVTPTNEIWQNNFITGINQELTIHTLAMTKVMEFPWGIAFVNHFPEAKRFDFDKDGQLHIFTATHKQLVFVRS